MTRQAVIRRTKIIFRVLGEILWRSFGLYIKFLSGGVLIGSITSAITGNLWLLFLGTLAPFIPALMDAWGEIGEEIARTAKVTDKGINRGFNTAIRLLEQQEAEQDAKKK